MSPASWQFRLVECGWPDWKSGLRLIDFDAELEATVRSKCVQGLLAAGDGVLVIGSHLEARHVDRVGGGFLRDLRSGENVGVQFDRAR